MPLKVECDADDCTTDIYEGTGIQIIEGEVVVDHDFAHAQQDEYHGLFCSVECAVAALTDEPVEVDGQDAEAQDEPDEAVEDPKEKDAVLEAVDESSEDAGSEDLPDEVEEDLDAPEPEDQEPAVSERSDPGEDEQPDEDEPEPEDEQETDEDSGTDDQAEPAPEPDDDEDIDPKTARIRDAMQGEGWMETQEIVDAADLAYGQLFHNRRDDLDIETRPHPEKGGNAKQYRLASEESVDESDADEPEQQQDQEPSEDRQHSDDVDQQRAEKAESAMDGEGWMSRDEIAAAVFDKTPDEVTYDEAKKVGNAIRNTDLDDRVEVRKHPDNGRKNQYRLTDHPADEEIRDLLADDEDTEADGEWPEPDAEGSVDQLHNHRHIKWYRCLAHDALFDNFTDAVTHRDEEDCTEWAGYYQDPRKAMNS